ncbi:MAG: DUF1616 domain-containing protein [Candidatus Lokiarchaeota archaeon]|nr:DUF1616 domain-containing protein [Candidatus Lokiarchaeota archaeon]
MNNTIKPTNRKEDISSRLEFDKLLKILLIIGIVVISGFILYYVLNPAPGFISFGVLNSEMKLDDYPTELSVGENASFYVIVENQLNREFTFRLEILKGDNETIKSSLGSEHATSFLNITNVKINHGIRWISDKLNVSFSEPGVNNSIIMELWEIKPDLKEVFYNILWLNLNVTI